MHLHNTLAFTFAFIPAILAATTGDNSLSKFLSRDDPGIVNGCTPSKHLSGAVFDGGIEGQFDFVTGTIHVPDVVGEAGTALEVDLGIGWDIAAVPGCLQNYSVYAGIVGQPNMLDYGETGYEAFYATSVYGTGERVKVANFTVCAGHKVMVSLTALNSTLVGIYYKNVDTKESRALYVNIARPLCQLGAGWVVVSDSSSPSRIDFGSAVFTNAKVGAVNGTYFGPVRANTFLCYTTADWTSLLSTVTAYETNVTISRIQ